MNQLSPEAQRVWAKLESSEKRAINKKFPFKDDRNLLLFVLRQQGVKPRVLVELSGLSQTQVYRVTERDNEPLVWQLRCLRRAIERLADTIERKT